jgi:hypothetical protein
MVCFQYIACTCHVIAMFTGSEDLDSLADLISYIADLLWCSVCACMQTQARVQLKERDSKPQMTVQNINPWLGPPAMQYMAAPWGAVPQQGHYHAHPHQATSGGFYPGQQQQVVTGYPQQQQYPGAPQQQQYPGAPQQQRYPGV